jgi:hypothetical protein
MAGGSIAGHPSLTKPGAPNDPIVRLVLKATVVNLEVRKPAGKWEKVAGESYTHSCKARRMSRHVALASKKSRASRC